MESLLRPPITGPGQLVCYCPPGVCQAPRGFRGPCNRAPGRDILAGMAEYDSWLELLKENHGVV